MTHTIFRSGFYLAVVAVMTMAGTGHGATYVYETLSEMKNSKIHVPFVGVSWTNPKTKEEVQPESKEELIEKILKPVARGKGIPDENFGDAFPLKIQVTPISEEENDWKVSFLGLKDDRGQKTRQDGRRHSTPDSMPNLVNYFEQVRVGGEGDLNPNAPDDLGLSEEDMKWWFEQDFSRFFLDGNDRIPGTFTEDDLAYLRGLKDEEGNKLIEVEGDGILIHNTASAQVLIALNKHNKRLWAMVAWFMYHRLTEQHATNLRAADDVLRDDDLKLTPEEYQGLLEFQRYLKDEIEWLKGFSVNIQTIDFNGGNATTNGDIHITGGQRITNIKDSNIRFFFGNFGSSGGGGGRTMTIEEGVDITRPLSRGL